MRHRDEQARAIDIAPTTGAAAPQHAPLAPSSAARWVQCPGSVVMSRAFPDAGDSDESAEGTLAHELAAQALRTGVDPVCDDEEMSAAIAIYTDAVRKAMGG